jgi:hypothetical protein
MHSAMTTSAVDFELRPQRVAALDLPDHVHVISASIAVR